MKLNIISDGHLHSLSWSHPRHSCGVFTEMTDGFSCSACPSYLPWCQKSLHSAEMPQVRSLDLWSTRRPCFSSLFFPSPSSSPPLLFPRLAPVLLPHSPSAQCILLPLRFVVSARRLFSPTQRTQADLDISPCIEEEEGNHIALNSTSHLETIFFLSLFFSPFLASLSPPFSIALCCNVNRPVIILLPLACRAGWWCVWEKSYTEHTSPTSGDPRLPSLHLRPQLSFMGR